MSTSAITAAEEAFTVLAACPAPLAFDARGIPGLPDRHLDLLQLRDLLTDRGVPAPVVDTVWRRLTVQARDWGPAWVVAAVGMAVPGLTDQTVARMAFEQADKNALVYVRGGSPRPLENVDRNNPRPGLRRWTARPMIDGDSHRWKVAWTSIHDDGSVSLAAAVGGHRRSSTEYNDDHVVESRDVETAIADFMGLIREASERLTLSEYEVKVGFEWNKSDPLQLWTIDQMGFSYTSSTIPLAQYTPVEVTIRADAEATDFYQQVVGARNPATATRPARIRGSGRRAGRV